MWSAHQEAVYLSGNPKELTTGSEYLLLPAPVTQALSSHRRHSFPLLTWARAHRTQAG
jgi:hypothetical protein